MNILTAQPIPLAYNMMRGWSDGNNMMGGGSWILGGLLMIVFWVFVVIMIVGIIRWFTWRGHAGPGGHMHMHMGGGI